MPANQKFGPYGEGFLDRHDSTVLTETLRNSASDVESNGFCKLSMTPTCTASCRAARTTLNPLQHVVLPIHRTFADIDECWPVIARSPVLESSHRSAQIIGELARREESGEDHRLANLEADTSQILRGCTISRQMRRTALRRWTKSGPRAALFSQPNARKLGLTSGFCRAGGT